MKTEDDTIRVDKLIEFFKVLKPENPRSDQADYTSWNQTELEYQKGQAEWLEMVKQKKNDKR